MAIEFVVEDGTSKSDATSYATVEQFRQYWENRGTDYTATTDDIIKAWLNSGTEYLDTTYNFEGEPTNVDQSLEWPRFGVQDRYGYDLESNEIPVEVMNSTIYMAAQAQSGSLQEVNEGIKSERYGPVSKTYSGNAGSKEYNYVDGQLKWYIRQGNILMRVN